MGKAAKKKSRRAGRFDPLSRPQSSAMQVEGEEDAPKLSAHQQRHLERKRNQAEQAALKQQRRKLSKADKLAHRKESKAISKALKGVKAEAAALRARLPAPAAASAPVADSLKDFRFNLPPAGGN